MFSRLFLNKGRNSLFCPKIARSLLLDVNKSKKAQTTVSMWADTIKRSEDAPIKENHAREEKPESNPIEEISFTSFESIDNQNRLEGNKQFPPLFPIGKRSTKPPPTTVSSPQPSQQTSSPFTAPPPKLKLLFSKPSSPPETSSFNPFESKIFDKKIELPEAAEKDEIEDAEIENETRLRVKMQLSDDYLQTVVGFYCGYYGIPNNFFIPSANFSQKPIDDCIRSVWGALGIMAHILDLIEHQPYKHAWNYLKPDIFGTFISTVKKDPEREKFNEQLLAVHNNHQLITKKNKIEAERIGKPLIDWLALQLQKQHPSKYGLTEVLMLTMFSDHFRYSKFCRRTIYNMANTPKVMNELRSLTEPRNIIYTVNLSKLYCIIRLVSICWYNEFLSRSIDFGNSTNMESLERTTLCETITKTYFSIKMIKIEELILFLKDVENVIEKVNSLRIFSQMFANMFKTIILDYIDKQVFTQPVGAIKIKQISNLLQYLNQILFFVKLKDILPNMDNFIIAEFENELKELERFKKESKHIYNINCGYFLQLLIKSSKLCGLIGQRRGLVSWIINNGHRFEAIISNCKLDHQAEFVAQIAKIIARDYFVELKKLSVPASELIDPSINDVMLITKEIHHTFLRTYLSSPSTSKLVQFLHHFCTNTLNHPNLIKTFESNPLMQIRDFVLALDIIEMFGLPLPDTSNIKKDLYERNQKSYKPEVKNGESFRTMMNSLKSLGYQVQNEREINCIYSDVYLTRSDSDNELAIEFDGHTHFYIDDPKDPFWPTCSRNLAYMGLNLPIISVVNFSFKNMVDSKNKFIEVTDKLFRAGRGKFLYAEYDMKNLDFDANFDLKYGSRR